MPGFAAGCRRHSGERMSNNEDRRGAAYHEAGHAVVAWALGLQIGDIVIGVGGDDAKGGTDIARDQAHLCKIDRIAICLAGLEAQEVFQAPIHEFAGARDLGMVIEIIGQDASEEQHRELRCAGYRRARELILIHEARVVRLATRLVERSEVKRQEFIDLMQAG